MPIPAGPEAIVLPPPPSPPPTAPPEDAPPENDDAPVYVPSLDDWETEVPELPVGTKAEIQAMLEAPTATYYVDDGADGFTVVETGQITEPGVETKWQEPEVLQDDKLVLLSESGAQTVGESK